MKAIITVEFDFDPEGSDSMSDAQWIALYFLTKHLMDDEDQTPIIFHQFEIK